MLSRNRRWRLDPYLILLLGLTLFALTPLFAPGYFYSAHDGRHSVFFVAMFDEAMRDGALWPVWAMHHNQGYGYPTFLIQPPLTFYVAELFVLLGVGVTNAVKATWAVAFLASAWGMYVLVRRWAHVGRDAGLVNAENGDWGGEAYRPAQAGLIAGLLYVYAPYHLLDIYVRAALAETMLMAWIPWVFWAFDRLIVGGTREGWPGRLAVTAFVYAGLMLTHAFAILAVTPLLITFILVRLWMRLRQERYEPGERYHNWKSTALWIGVVAASGIAALLLVAVFVLPLLLEGSFLAQEDWVSDTYSYARHWVHWGQFFSSFWGYGYSDDPVGANDGMSFQLGLMNVVLAIAAAYLLLTRRWRASSGLALFVLLATVAALYLMTPAAAWLWGALPLLSVLQFPWRLLTLVAFLLSALGGLTVAQMSNGEWNSARTSQLPAAFLMFAVIIIVASAGYVGPASLESVEAWREDGRAVFQFEREHPDMLGYTRLVQERFTETPLTPQYAAAMGESERFDSNRLERLGILHGVGRVTSAYSRSQHFGGQVVMESPGVVQIRVFDFPGWQVRLDGQPVEHRPSPPHGVIEVDVPAGEHRIDMEMGRTLPRTLGAVISGMTLLVVVGLLMMRRRSRTP